MIRAPIAVLALAGLAACDDRPVPTAPARDAHVSRSVTSDENRTYTLNAVLRGIEDPNICPDPGSQPALNAMGHVTVSLTRSVDDPDMYEAVIRGRVLRPERFELTAGFIEDPNILPVFGITIGARTDPKAFASLSGGGRLPSSIAQFLIEDPNIFVARFESLGGTELCGRFGFGDTGIVIE